MRFLWKLFKVALGLAIAIPVILLVLATTLGIFGIVSALAILVLRVALVCLVVWGAIKVAISFFGGGSRREKAAEIKPLPPVDPHYEDAMRELDRELGEPSRYK
jgi:hypothetical protein